MCSLWDLVLDMIRVRSIFLDTHSAYDKTINSILIQQLILARTQGHRLVYLDNRLFNRITFVEWDKRVMGPIQDNKAGMERGGIPSSDLHSIYNNESLNNIQDLKL